MVISAETRWFWWGTPPGALERWFTDRPIPPGGGTPRVDEYLLDREQQELGIKTRGGGNGGDGVEIKGLVELRRALPEPFSARVQIWTKWKSNRLRLDGLPRVRVGKTRRLRKFDTGSGRVVELPIGADELLLDRAAPLPERGCHIELVALEAGDAAERWSSLGFEAFGPIETVEDSLTRTLAAVGSPDRDALSNGLELSYPAWLARFR